METFEKKDYNYDIEIRTDLSVENDDWKKFGQLDKDAAFDPGGDSQAEFHWNPGTEGKSIFFRWKIDDALIPNELTEWPPLVNPFAARKKAA